MIIMLTGFIPTMSFLMPRKHTLYLKEFPHLVQWQCLSCLHSLMINKTWNFPKGFSIFITRICFLTSMYSLMFQGSSVIPESFHTFITFKASLHYVFSHDKQGLNCEQNIQGHVPSDCCHLEANNENSTANFSCQGRC